MEIGFIGTGNMGNPMARNLLRAGHALVVHDAREAAAADLLELGATWADGPRAVAERCALIFTSLPGPAEIEAVIAGPGGVLEGARPGTVVFELSTNAPPAVRSLAARARARAVTLLDAPVSGGRAGAEKGTLSVLVGGDREAFDTYRPVLAAIGSNLFYLGEAGQGTVAKLMNNLIALSIGPLLQEALVTGVKAGIDARTLYEVFQVSSAGPLVRGIPRILAKQWDDPTFALELAAKDVGLAVQLGRDCGVPMPVAASVEQIYLWAKGAGLGNKNSLATLTLYENAAGVSVE